MLFWKIENMSILYYEANELWFQKLRTWKIQKKNYLWAYLPYDHRGQNLMGEIDAENAFDNSKSFYDICFHKVGIKNSFIMVKFIYQIPKENIIFN